MTEETSQHFTFQVIKRVAVLSTDSTGWTKELNLISYHGKPPVWDIRKWSSNGHMSRGITLKKHELEALQKALETIKIEEGEMHYGSGS